LSVDLKFVFRLSKQIINNVSIHLKANFSRFIDEILIPNTFAILDIVKSERKIKLIKKEVKVLFILVILTNNDDNAK